jgi:hypothetical protein
VPVSLLVVARTIRVPSVEEGLNVYLNVDDLIVVWPCEVEIKVQEIEAAGVADTEHGMVMSCPVTTLYEF